MYEKTYLGPAALVLDVDAGPVLGVMEVHQEWLVYKVKTVDCAPKINLHIPDGLEGAGIPCRSRSRRARCPSARRESGLSAMGVEPLERLSAASVPAAGVESCLRFCRACCPRALYDRGAEAELGIECVGTRTPSCATKCVLCISGLSSSCSRVSRLDERP